MSNSKLVSYTRLLNNCNKMSNKQNKKITIHHMAGNLSLKKLLDIVLVLVAYSLDWLLSFNYIGISVLYFLIAMEFYSVLENVREYLPLPELLIKILDMLQKKGEEINE